MLVLQGCALSSGIGEITQIMHPSRNHNYNSHKESGGKRILSNKTPEDVNDRWAISQELKPKFKELSPLDFQKVTMSFVEEDYRVVLQALSHAAGLNLIIDSDAEELLNEGRTLTAEFQERPLRSVLDYVCKAMDLTWKEKDGTIFIHGYEKAVINLDFLNSIQESKFNVGGDVLGGALQVEILAEVTY